MLSAAQWLDAIGVGPWARGSSLAYPIVNIAHLFGLVMLVGAIGVLDLRLAGLWHRIPVEPLATALQPIAVTGLIVLAASGIPLFAADGKALAASSVFHWKLGVVALATLNAILFRAGFRGRLAGVDAALPGGVRALALASLALWATVIVLGRMIAYS